MLDCEVATITAFPGLLANIYDAEIPLLRGTPHPTAKAGRTAGGPNDSPTGPEIVDLLAEAIGKVYADPAVADEVLTIGIVGAMFNSQGFGSAALGSLLQQMAEHNMLRLFGVTADAGFKGEWED